MIGCLAGSLVAVLDEKVIEWTWFVPALIVGAIGVAMVQIALRKQAGDTDRSSANFTVLATSLRDVVSGLGELDQSKDGIDVYDLPARIDSRFRGPISDFVDARESIAHVCGMRAYAAVMSHFAAGERYLNRVWSCAADGYIDEAHTYITRSHEQFQEALAQLEAVAPDSAEA